jgi:TatD DNase family protein
MATVIPFYDTHAHLDFPDFREDLPALLERADAAGITRIITVGTDLESSRQSVALAEKYPQIWAVVGWHPSHASAAPPDLRPALRELARHPKVVAIGETGLDYHRLPTTKPGGTAAEDERVKQDQARIFRQQLDVAAECGLNVVVHQRDCFDDTLAEMQAFAGRVRGVFHCFGGSVAQMERVVAVGSLVSFTGVVTFKNADSVRATVAATPLDRLMLETDCPYLAPVPYRGKRCEPAHVRETADAVARARGCSLEELSRATCENAHRFFARMSAV